MVEPDVFNCRDCKLGRYCDKEKKWPGSKGHANIANKFEIKEIGYVDNVCPKPTIDEGALFLIKLYNHYKNSVFPVSGGYLEQPRKYIEMMDFIEAVS